MNRRQLLWSGAAASLAAMLPWQRKARATTSSQKKNLIVLLVFGGWDTTYAVDPKPRDGVVDIPPEGDIVQHGNLDVFEDRDSRPAIGQFFTAHASITAIVRGIRLSAVSHEACVQAMLTGARSETSPDVAAIVAQANGLALPMPYLVCGNQAFAGPFASSMGRVGATNQIVGLLDSDSAYPIDGVASAFAPTRADEDTIRAYTKARADRERAVRGATGYNKRRIDDFVSSLDRGDDLRSLRSKLGARGTQLDLAGQRELALNVLEGGISRTVMMSSGLNWDTHDVNTQQSASHQTLFDNLLQLVDGLKTRQGHDSAHNLLDDTVIAVISEMGRTPQLDNGGTGKSHWPVTSSMIIGTGIAGGRAYGGTSPTGEALPCDFATGSVSTSGRSIEPKHFAAGVLAACGVDPQEYLPEAEAFDAFVA